MNQDQNSHREFDTANVATGNRMETETSKTFCSFWLQQITDVHQSIHRNEKYFFSSVNTCYLQNPEGNF